MSAGWGIRAELQGLAPVLARLDTLKQTTRGRVMRKAMNAATKPILADARARVATQSKLLRKSLGRKIKTYAKTGVTVGLIGPRKGFKRQVKIGRGKKRRTEMRNPTRYAHLVELGRGPVAIRVKKVLAGPERIYGRKVAAVRPRPFLRPAWDANKDKAEAILAQVIADEIKKLK